MSPQASDASRDQIVYRIDEAGTLIWVDDAWATAAHDNGAPELAAPTGRSVWHAIDDAGTRDLWQRFCNAALASGATLAVPYRCDSPSEHRWCLVEVAPMRHGEIELRHRVERRAPRRNGGRRPLSAPAVHTGRVCSWCLRVDVDGEWYEIDEVTDTAALFIEGARHGVSYGTCPQCAGALLTVFPRCAHRRSA